MGNLRLATFLPAIICMIITITFTLINKEFFISATTEMNNAIINNLSWLFNLSAVCMVGAVTYAYVSPLGKVVIGGQGAKRIYTPFKWFAVSLTTVIAMGILFWAVAEPIVHYYNPPAHSGVEAQTPQAAQFAMSTIFVHWTITPYAIYTVASLVFALALHNLKMKFSIGSMFRPLLGKMMDGRLADVIDGLALFAVVMGMSATLTSGLLIINDGAQSVLGINKSPITYGIIAIIIIGSALFSATTGLHKGIQILSRINTWIYFIAIAFFFFIGPTSYILSLGVETFGLYLSNWFSMNLVTGAAANSQWPGWWTVAFFASWFAWAPLTSLFLGKIARGYTVRQFIIVNVTLPCVFAFFWFSTFSGSSLYLDSTLGGTLYEAYKTTGFASVIYVLFEQFPLTTAVSSIFIIACFITFITAADSNTDAIGSLCINDASSENMSSPIWIKVVWGGSIAFIAWISASYIGVDAIKMLFNLAGLPGMIICIGALFSLIRLITIVRNSEEPILDSSNYTEPDLSLSTFKNNLTNQESATSRAK